MLLHDLYDFVSLIKVFLCYIQDSEIGVCCLCHPVYSYTCEVSFSGNSMVYDTEYFTQLELQLMLLLLITIIVYMYMNI